MKNTRQNNHDDVIDLLVKKYWSESNSELDQKIGQIAQDFIGRKTYNNTVRINKQLHTEYEFLQKLIEHIIESIKQDFSHIPLATCKEKLLSVVEIEYKKLIPNTTSRLVQANFGQKYMLEQYKGNIIDEMEEAKEKIEIQCAISEEEKIAVKHSGEKWYKNRTIQAALIGAGVFLIVSIITIFHNESPTSRSPSDSNNLSEKTLIYENLGNRVSNLEHQIIDEKISPWIFFRTGKMKEVTNYHGKVIKYSGIEFTGSPRLVFWNGFIEPFLENGIAQVLNSAAQDCQDRNIDNTEFLQEAESLLTGLISKVYRRMSEIDKKLRGQGYPEKVTPVDVSDKIGKMQEFLNQYMKAILNNEKPPRKRYD